MLSLFWDLWHGVHSPRWKENLFTWKHRPLRISISCKIVGPTLYILWYHISVYTIHIISGLFRCERPQTSEFFFIHESKAWYEDESILELTFWTENVIWASKYIYRTRHTCSGLCMIRKSCSLWYMITQIQCMSKCIFWYVEEWTIRMYSSNKCGETLFNSRHAI